MTEVLRDKVFISSFFKFKIAITVYNTCDFLKFMFQKLKVTRFIFVSFPKKTIIVIIIVIFFSSNSLMCFLVYKESMIGNQK